MSQAESETRVWRDHVQQKAIERFQKDGEKSPASLAERLRAAEEKTPA